MVKFKKGDKVIALSDGPRNGQVRKKGETYVVNRVMFCQACGFQFLNTGGIHKNGIVVCGECEHEQDSWDLNWSSSDNYILVNEKSVDELIQECIDSDDFEQAVILRDLKIDNLSPLK
jgi:hypothetical protein